MSDIYADMSDEAIAARLEVTKGKLWRSCRQYQENHLTDDIAAMYYQERNNSTKAQACLDWKDALWTDYFTRKESDVNNRDFSNHGAPPHSYLEVRAEVEAL